MLTQIQYHPMFGSVQPKVETQQTYNANYYWVEISNIETNLTIRTTSSYLNPEDAIIAWNKMVNEYVRNVCKIMFPAIKAIV